MSWSKVPIKDICIGIYDGPHATPPVSESGAIFLGIPNFVNGRLDLSDIRYISEDDLPKWTKRVTPKENDIVFSYEATLNLYAIIPAGFRGCLGRRMALIRVDETKAYYKYLYYYFYSNEWRKVIAENTVIGATVDRIPLVSFPNFPVELPDLDTQHKIADTLSAYDDLIENNRRQIKLLEEAARRLYREWFVDFRFPGHEQVKIVDGVPEGWKSCTVSEIAEINSDSISSDYSYPYIDYIDIGSVNRGRIENETRYSLNEAPGRAKRIAHDGDIIWGMVRPNLQSYALILHPSPTNVFSTGFAIISAQRIPFTFLYCAVTEEKFISYLVNCTNGAAYPAVKPIHFEKAVLLLPANEILQKFHNQTEPIFKKIAVLQTISNKAKYSLDTMIKTVIDYDK